VTSEREKEPIVVDKEAFTTPEDRDYTIIGSYLTSPKGEALIEVYLNGQKIRWFLFPAYKIWNIAAHASGIIDSEIAGDHTGHDIAAWTGFGYVPVRSLPPDGAPGRTGQ
jgi:hypothetical protein